MQCGGNGHGSLSNFELITDWNCDNSQKPEKQSGKLADFDVVNCQYHSEFSVPMLSLKMDCSRWTTSIDLVVLKLGITEDMNKKDFADRFMSTNVEIGPSRDAAIHAGPLSIGAEVGARLGIEIDRNGISDVYVKASASTGVEVGDLGVELGQEAKVSLISGGPSFEGTAGLKLGDIQLN